MNGPAVIAVVGAGFSGTMSAIQLRHALPNSRVVLLERSNDFGPGVAYAEAHETYLLNVRSSNMSALPDDPGHFERWLAAQQPASPTGLDGGPGAHLFAQRSLYGRYLRAMLAEERARVPGLLQLRNDQVLRLARADGGWRLECGSGTPLYADAVVIATGNLPSAAPSDGVVFHNPWAPGVLDGLRSGEPVLIVGTGLTMVDLAQRLQAMAFAGPVLAVSRRGLLPQRHAAPTPAWPCPDSLLSPGLSPSALLHGLRHAVRDAATQGVGWRAVIDGLRPVTVGLWQGWTVPQRARFLRHLRPYWDSHRHRMAPVVADRFEAMVDAGRLQLRRGRVAAITVANGPGGPAAQVTLRQRGTPHTDVVEVQRVILATGAGAGLAEDPLLAGLLATGTARADGNGLGLDVTDALEVLGRNACPAAGLWALGPVVRGTFWECTSVPDIRMQARTLAASVARFFERRMPHGAG